VWKISDFSLKSTTSGVTVFPYSSWGDYVTYVDENGAGDGHIWLHALAKNYLEIALSNLFRAGLGLDHVGFGKNADWEHKGFFMRYQEIELSADFYDLLRCPRRTGKNANQEHLSIASNVVQVGSTSCK